MSANLKPSSDAKEFAYFLEASPCQYLKTFQELGISDGQKIEYWNQVVNLQFQLTEYLQVYSSSPQELKRPAEKLNK